MLLRLVYNSPVILLPQSWKQLELCPYTTMPDQIQSSLSPFF